MGKKVAVIGAAGGIGSFVSFLLKKNIHVDELNLYDIGNIGVAADLSHICCPGKVRGFQGPSQVEIRKCLRDVDFAMIPAGFPRLETSSGEMLERSALFSKNGDIIKDISLACAEVCPRAHIMIITNPVNSVVPVAYEVMKSAGVVNPSVFGICKLDVVRARTFLAEKISRSPATIQVDVVGGHSQDTMVPLISTAKGIPKDIALTDEEVKAWIHRIKFGGDAVYKAKDTKGTAQLSMAYAADLFFTELVEAMENNGEITSYVFDEAHKETHGFLSQRIKVDKSGKCGLVPLPRMSDIEKELFDASLKTVRTDVMVAYDYLKQSPSV